MWAPHPDRGAENDPWVMLSPRRTILFRRDRYVLVEVVGLSFIPSGSLQEESILFLSVGSVCAVACADEMMLVIESRVERKRSGIGSMRKSVCTALC